MTRYLHKYNLPSELNSDYYYNSEEYRQPWVSHTDGRGVDYNLPYSAQPFTIEMLSAGTIQLKYDWDGENDWYFRENVYYWINGDYENGEWCNFNNYYISVNAGDKVSFESDSEHPYSYYDPSNGSSLGINYIHVTSPFIVYGNLNSLNHWQTSLRPSWGADSPYGYYSRFLAGNEFLISAKNLLIFDNGDNGEYYLFGSFFSNCTNLREGPRILGGNLNPYCYSNMFTNCSSLISAPELPSTSLAMGCYYSMFYGCTSLTTAPKLPAETMAAYCYNSMFSRCTSLTTAPELPATTLFNNCYQSMFAYCTGLTSAPELTMSALAENSCYQMFYGCTNLKYIKCLAKNISASNCTYSWLNSASPTGTFVKSPFNTKWTRGVSGIPTGWDVVDDYDYDELIKTPLTFVILSAGTINWWHDLEDSKTIQYSKNGGSWTSIASTTGNGTTISVAVGDTVAFRGDNATYGDEEGNDCSACFNNSTAYFNAVGNIMSLINSTGFSATTVLTSSYNFQYLFYRTPIVNANRLLFPATILSEMCYSSVFSRCNNLISAPELPATKLEEGCYSYMFNNCTSLTVPPSLPATELADYCYGSMFANCSNIIIAPELPAIKLETRCYESMFNSCTSLTSPPSLPATKLTYNCYNSMFYGCTSLTSPPSLPARELAGSCYYAMFRGCTSLTTAPELPATEVDDSCYSCMFYGCTSLTTAPELPARKARYRCYDSMFSNCTSLTVPPSLPATKLNGWCYSYMFSNCTGLTTAPELPATELAVYCYYDMFTSCTSLRTAPVLPAKILVSNCYSYMFDGCTNLTSAPGILGELFDYRSCYYMFRGCPKIRYVKCNATDLSATECTYRWLYNAPMDGKFVKCSDVWNFGDDGIPWGWEVEVENQNRPLTMRILNDGIIKWKALDMVTDGENAKSITIARYNKNMEQISRRSYTSTQAGVNISVETGDFLEIWGQGIGNGYYEQFNTFSGSTSKFNVYGNIMSICGNLNQTILTGKTLYGLFEGTNVVNAESLVLPATTIEEKCYSEMFYGCSQLITAPMKLPATTLNDECYEDMFLNCSTLITAPKLPATALAMSCYYRMFYGCVSLRTAPYLPAMTLSTNCYYQMFKNCFELNYVKCNATNISASNCTYDWLSSACYRGMFVTPNMSIWGRNATGVPSSWVLRTANNKKTVWIDDFSYGVNVEEYYNCSLYDIPQGMNEYYYGVNMWFNNYNRPNDGWEYTLIGEFKYNGNWYYIYSDSNSTYFLTKDNFIKISRKSATLPNARSLYCTEAYELHSDNSVAYQSPSSRLSYGDHDFSPTNGFTFTGNVVVDAKET